MQKYNAEKELKKMDDYYPHSDLSSTYKKHRGQIIELFKTIELIWKTKKINDQSFEILFDGLKNSWHGVYYEIVGKEINAMLGNIEGIERIISYGINNSQWKIRFHTLVIMKGITDKEIQKTIVALGMMDKSKKVREMAADIKNHWMYNRNQKINEC